jgi:hypothetical protein
MLAMLEMVMNNFGRVVGKCVEHGFRVRMSWSWATYDILWYCLPDSVPAAARHRFEHDVVFFTNLLEWRAMQCGAHAGAEVRFLEEEQQSHKVGLGSMMNGEASS